MTSPIPSPISQAAGEPTTGIPPEFVQWFNREWAAYLDKAFTNKVTAGAWALKAWKFLSVPTQGADARPVAVNLPCPICNGVEGCDHTAPERRRATSDAHTQLMKFYAVETTDALIAEMERHIQKLQSKLPQYRDPINQRVREG